MSDYMKSLYENAAYIKSKISIIPKVALVLGSGLGSLADEFPLAERVPYSVERFFFLCRSRPINARREQVSASIPL